jgi:DNA uptake protein ComE-like DNA-binding protein
MRTFVAGLGLGFGIGVLMAPDRGEATRGRLRDAAEQALDAGREQLNRVARKAGSLVGQNEATILNTVSREDLIAIPGIGPVLADRIIKGRPYSSEEELTQKNIIPDSVFRELRRKLLQPRST